MNESKDLILQIKEAMLTALSGLVASGLDEANLVMNNQASLSRDGQKINQDKTAIVERFQKHAAKNFDELVGTVEKSVNVLDYGSLSLVEEDDLEAIIAMEGMIAHARNCDIQEYLSFSTRLDTLFYGTRIDESNNPMDPEQIGDAYKEAIRPVGLSPAGLLMAYRYFNSSVFHKLEEVLVEANEILVANGILPELDIAARDKKIQKNKRSLPREKKDPTDRAFSDPEKSSQGSGPSAQQMFSVMQNLMHGMAQSAPAGGNTATGVPAAAGLDAASANQSGFVPQAGGQNYAALMPGGVQPGMMVGSQRVEVVPSDQLLSLLGGIQQNLDVKHESDSGQELSSPIDLRQSIGEILQEKSSNETLSALDSQSSDVINLVTLLFEAIWEDETVPIPVKELIGRTQISILRIALNDPGFF